MWQSASQNDEGANSSDNQNADPRSRRADNPRPNKQGGRGGKTSKQSQRVCPSFLPNRPENKKGCHEQQLAFEHRARRQQRAAPEPAFCGRGKRGKQIKRQDPNIPLRPAVCVEDHRRLQPGNACRRQSANPCTPFRGNMTQETRLGRARCSPHPKANQKEKRHCRDELAKEIDTQQWFNPLRVSVIHCWKFSPHLRGPDRHCQKSQWRIIELIVVLVGFAFYAIVQCEVTSEERRPGIGRVRRQFASFGQSLAAPVEAVDDIMLEAHVLGLLPRPLTQRDPAEQDRDDQKHSEDASGKSSSRLRNHSLLEK